VGYLMNKCMRKTNHKTNLNEVAGALPAAWRSVVIGQAGGANVNMGQMSAGLCYQSGRADPGPRALVPDISTPGLTRPPSLG
jgi:hypothetical protein